LIKYNLLAGNNACYRSSGWSLHPRVWPNDLTTYAPVTSADQVHEKDIVFCQVQPGDRFYAHLVKRKEWHHSREEWVFTISNAKGRENGWCYMRHIYGQLVRCEH
jgi:hypothetical protein